MTDTEIAGTSALLKAKQVAQQLGVSETTLSRWRTEGGGPHWVNLGGTMPRYTQADVDAYVAGSRQ